MVLLRYNQPQLQWRREASLVTHEFTCRMPPPPAMHPGIGLTLDHPSPAPPAQCHSKIYLISLCTVIFFMNGLYFLSSNLSGVFFLFFCVVYRLGVWPTISCKCKRRPHYTFT